MKTIAIATGFLLLLAARAPAARPAPLVDVTEEGTAALAKLKPGTHGKLYLNAHQAQVEDVDLELVEIVDGTSAVVTAHIAVIGNILELRGIHYTHYDVDEVTGGTFLLRGNTTGHKPGDRYTPGVLVVRGAQAVKRADGKEETMAVLEGVGPLGKKSSHP